MLKVTVLTAVKWQIYCKTREIQGAGEVWLIRKTSAGRRQMQVYVVSIFVYFCGWDFNN